MFEWHRKLKLAEQLKFFGAKKQGFISVYAKKPRIRVEVKKPVPLLNGMPPIKCNDNNRGFINDQALGSLLANMQNNHGTQLANLAAQGQANMQNIGMGMYGGQGGQLAGLCGMGAAAGMQQAQAVHNQQMRGLVDCAGLAPPRRYY